MNLSIVAFSVLLGFGVAAQSQEPTKEMREKMAASHEKMAQCLRSEKTFEDCHDQMRTQCQGSDEDGGCMMMGMGKMHKGMMHKKMHQKKSQKMEADK